MTEHRRIQQRYVYTATAEEFIREMNSKPRILSKETRHNREKAKHMNIGYVLFLVAALFLCAMILINYIQSQAELTAKISKISREPYIVLSISFRSFYSYFLQSLSFLYHFCRRHEKEKSCGKAIEKSGIGFQTRDLIFFHINIIK